MAVKGEWVLTLTAGEHLERELWFWVKKTEGWSMFSSQNPDNPPSLIKSLKRCTILGHMAMALQRRCMLLKSWTIMMMHAILIYIVIQTNKMYIFSSQIDFKVSHFVSWSHVDLIFVLPFMACDMWHLTVWQDPDCLSPGQLFSRNPNGVDYESSNFPNDIHFL